MRSSVITRFKNLKKTEEGITDFVIFGRAILASELDRRQIERTMRHCVNLTDSEFTLKEAVEHFYRLSRWPLGSRKRAL